MTGEAPLFSIVLPTRDRAHLVGHSLRSALDQTFDDYEIVLSDNHSSDGTAEVVREFGSDRVRYFRTDRPLSMPDSWEFALSKARGEWIAFLEDDDAVSAKLLKKVAEVIEEARPSLVTWNVCGYYHQSWFNPAQRNQMWIPHFTSRSSEQDAQAQIAKLFSFRENWSGMRFMNSCFRREIVDRVRARLGRFFLPPAPDYSAGAAMLSLMKSTIHLDIPLHLAGIAGNEGMHGSGYRTPRAVQFQDEFEEKNLFAHVPFPSNLVGNIIGETLLRVKEAMPDHFSDVFLDWRRYFVVCYLELSLLGMHGFDVAAEMRRFLDVLRRQPVSLQAGVRLLAGRELGARFLRKMIRPLFLKWPATTNRLYPLLGRRLVRGKDGHFSNIYEASKYLDGFLDAWPLRNGSRPSVNSLQATSDAR